MVKKSKLRVGDEVVIVEGSKKRRRGTYAGLIFVGFVKDYNYQVNFGDEESGMFALRQIKKVKK